MTRPELVSRLNQLLKQRLSRSKAITVLASVALISLLTYLLWTITLLNQVTPLNDAQVKATISKWQRSDSPEVNGTYFSNDEKTALIPELGLELGIYEGIEALDQGLWHRYPDRGNPVDGGNFILSGHRLSIGWTPEQTRKASPLYHIEKLEIGDEIIIGWLGEIYRYEIRDIWEVAPTQTDIEEETLGHYLTLYTCTLEGASDGRIVIRAYPA